MAFFNHGTSTQYWSPLRLKKLYTNAIQSNDHSVVAEAEQIITDFCDRLQREEDITLRMQYADVVEDYKLQLAELRQKKTMLFNTSKKKRAQELILAMQRVKDIYIEQSLDFARQQELINHGMWDSGEEPWVLRPATSMFRQMFSPNRSIDTHGTGRSRTQEERRLLLEKEYRQLLRNTMNPKIRLRREEIFDFDPDVADWEPVKDVGSGAHGRVYTIIVQDPKIQEDANAVFAVKEIKYKNAQQKANMSKECQLLSKVERHHHVVALIAFRFWTRIGNIFMEYVSGGDLGNMLEYTGRVEERGSKPMLRQILIGLQFLHNKHIVHRDIKGANILITLQGCVKIGDFGSAKEVSPDSVPSEDDYYAGSAFWMSPEIAHAWDLQHPYATDIWSLGCLIVEILTGKPPWPDYQKKDKDDLDKTELLTKKLTRMATGEQPIEAPPLHGIDLSSEGRRVLSSIFVPASLRPDVNGLLRDPWFQVASGLLLPEAQ